MKLPHTLIAKDGSSVPTFNHMDTLYSFLFSLKMESIERIVDVYRNTLFADMARDKAVAKLCEKIMAIDLSEICKEVHHEEE